jgi:hypothetical protein
MKSSNPMQMLMGLLTPEQKQSVNFFQTQPREEQAKRIAEYCNKNGITKEQLKTILKKS